MSTESIFDENLSNEERSEIFSNLPSQYQNYIFGMAFQENALREEKKKILDVFYKSGQGLFVISIISDFAVIGEYNNPEDFRSSFRDESGYWRKVNYVSHSIEKALLHAMGEKFEGNNSHFADYAMKMLGKE